MADIDKNLVLITFLSRAVRENVTLRIGDSTYLGVAGLKTLSLDTFARLGDGTTIVDSRTVSLMIRRRSSARHAR